MAKRQLKRPLLGAAFFLLFLGFTVACGSEFSVDSKPQGATTANNSGDVQEFVGGTGVYEIEGCDLSGVTDIAQEPDTDRDGIIDICDNFVIERPDFSFMIANDSYYFGYKVWGTRDPAQVSGHDKNSNPNNASDKTFAIYNVTANPLTVTATIEGSDSGNFSFKNMTTGALSNTFNATIPNSADAVPDVDCKNNGMQDANCCNGTNCQLMSLKIHGTDTNSKSASVRFSMGGKEYLMPVSGSTLVCNGNSLYCERRFNQVAYMSNHNAHTSEDDFDGLLSFIGINQVHEVGRQMSDQIRGLMLDWYEDDGRIRNCHGDCVWGWTDAINQNLEISIFMQNNPGEVFHMINEIKMGAGAQADANKTMNTLIGGGLGYYLFNFKDPLYIETYGGTAGNDGSPGSAWPHLGWMVEKQKRMVVFVEGTAASADNGGITNSDSLFGHTYMYYPGSYDTNENKMKCKGRNANSDPGNHNANYFYVLSVWQTCDPTSGSGFICNFGGGIKSAANTFNDDSFYWPFAVQCWNNIASHSGDGDFNSTFNMPSSLNVDFYNESYSGFRKTRDGLNNAWPNRPSFPPSPL